MHAITPKTSYPKEMDQRLIEELGADQRGSLPALRTQVTWV